MPNKSKIAIQEYFVISPILYFISLFLICVGLAFGTFSDIVIFDKYLIVFDIINITGILIGFVLVMFNRISYRLAFSIILYSCIINYLASMFQVIFLPSGSSDTWKVTFQMFNTVIFMAVGGFIISKWASLFIGMLLLSSIITISIFHNDTNLIGLLCLIVPALLGFTYVLFYYRSQIENLLLKLNQVNKDILSQNVNLKDLKEEAEKSLLELKKAQTSIVAQEKLASLGMLTAGIAHEIKNPLNFIINFSESSIELMDNLYVLLQKCKDSLTESESVDFDFLFAELKQNMRDIGDHGWRSDHIIRSMLMHARSGESTFAFEDLNSLAMESLKLAYHGWIIQDSKFHCHLDFVAADGLEKTELVRGDIFRVFVNLCNNSFYSIGEKLNNAGSIYSPGVRVVVSDLGSLVEVEIWDNGNGISESIREKMFMPFFSTKPSGQGTGLGLSMSYEIIVKEHGGSISVESVEGEWAKFIIRIPKRVNIHGSSYPGSTDH